MKREERGAQRSTGSWWRSGSLGEEPGRRRPTEQSQEMACGMRDIQAGQRVGAGCCRTAVLIPKLEEDDPCDLRDTGGTCVAIGQFVRVGVAGAGQSGQPSRK